MRDLMVTAATALLSAAAGAWIAVSVTGDPDPPSWDRPAGESADVDELRARIAALEEALAFSLSEPPIDPGAGQSAATPHIDVAERPEAEDVQLTVEERVAQDEQRRRARTESRLREAGWNDAEIASLERIRDEARLLQEQRQYEALRKIAEENDGMLMFLENERSAMRVSMGDERYEQYLDALGRPVSVEVRGVLPGSPGDSAGLRAGDQILRYGTERVFSEQDLMLAIIGGEPDEYVTVEIERDGMRMHVSMPRGPLGTSRRGGPF